VEAADGAAVYEYDEGGESVLVEADGEGEEEAHGGGERGLGWI
jgi:hypothetical protein